MGPAKQLKELQRWEDQGRLDPARSLAASSLADWGEKGARTMSGLLRSLFGAREEHEVEAASPAPLDAYEQYGVNEEIALHRHSVILRLKELLLQVVTLLRRAQCM